MISSQFSYDPYLITHEVKEKYFFCKKLFISIKDEKIKKKFFAVFKHFEEHHKIKENEWKVFNSWQPFCQWI